MKNTAFVLLALSALTLTGRVGFADPSPSTPPKPKSTRDDRLDGADYSRMPFTAFKFSEQGVDGKARSLSSRMDLLATKSKRIPIGVSKKKGEDPKVVLVQEVTADNITASDIDQVVSACYGPTHPVPFERNMLSMIHDPTTPPDRKKSIQKAIDDYRARQKAEKKGIVKAVTEAVNYMKSYSLGGMTTESEVDRRSRTDDDRSPLKWYTWHAGIGEKDDASLSEGFGEEINDYMPRWYPSNDFESEQHRQARPEVVAFKIDLDCLKKAWKPAYARASKSTLRCELDFKEGVKSGETFDPKTLKSLLFSGLNVKPGAWTEFTITHPRIKSLWCDDRVKTISDLGRFFDLKTSDMKIQDQYLPAHPTPAPTKTPASNPGMKKPTIKAVPASSSLLEKDNLKESDEKPSAEKKTDAKSGN